MCRPQAEQPYSSSSTVAINSRVATEGLEIAAS